MCALSFTPCHKVIGIGRTESKLPTVVLRQVNGLWLAVPFDPVTEREYAEQRLSRLAGDGWSFIWQSATATFHIMLCSLAASSLPIEKFNIFNKRRLQHAVAWLVMNLVTGVLTQRTCHFFCIFEVTVSQPFGQDYLLYILDAERSYDMAEVVTSDLSEGERDIDDMRQTWQKIVILLACKTFTARQTSRGPQSTSLSPQ
jgi:hypothetical protein